MRGLRSGNGVDRDLIAGWLAGRSIARGVPAPVADHGGWRVDKRSDAEWCRYVFADPARAITDLANAIDQPRIFLKLCSEDQELMQLLPERWQVGPSACVMTSGAWPDSRPLPIGYTATVERDGGAIRASITDATGALAASGYAAEVAGAFVYDRIVTSPEHQRRGLGRGVMTLLRAQRQSDDSRQVLTATEQGRFLYASLGWHVYARYATAFIPDPGV